MDRRTFIAGAGASLVSTASAWSSPASLPLVKVMHGFPVGGTADVAARRAADKLQGHYASTAIVDSRSGAGGRIVIEVVKSAPPDGSVIVTVPMSTLAIYPHVYRHLSYDPFTDLKPISLAATFELALAVGQSVPATVQTVRQLFDWMRGDASRAIFGSPGAGTSPHFLGALLSQLAGLPLSQVPYRGSVPGLTDVMGGQLPLMITALGDCLPHLPQGKLRVLASSGLARSRFSPQVPTLIESGYPDAHHVEWIGVFGPARMSDALVAQASQAMLAADKAKSLEPLNLFGMEPAGTNPASLRKLLRADYERWGPIIQKTGFKVDA